MKKLPMKHVNVSTKEYLKKVVFVLLVLDLQSIFILCHLLSLHFLNDKTNSANSAQQQINLFFKDYILQKPLQLIGRFIS